MRLRLSGTVTLSYVRPTRTRAFIWGAICDWALPHWAVSFSRWLSSDEPVRCTRVAPKIIHATLAEQKMNPMAIRRLSIPYLLLQSAPLLCSAKLRTLYHKASASARPYAPESGLPQRRFEHIEKALHASERGVVRDAGCNVDTGRL